MCEQLTEQVLLHGLGAVQTDCALLEDVLQELGPLRQTAHTETLRVLAACRASQPDLMTHTSTSSAPRPASRSTCWFKHRAWRLNCGEARGRAKRERGEGWETAGQPGGIHVHVWDRTYRRVRACVWRESFMCLYVYLLRVCAPAGSWTAASQEDHFQPAGDLTLMCCMLMCAADLRPQTAEETCLG